MNTDTDYPFLLKDTADTSRRTALDYIPLKLHPCYKDYLWGGKRLKTEYEKTDAPEITAESWELAACEDGLSTVEDGPLAGKNLLELGEIDHDGFWGRNCRSENFPLLVKFIDAKKNLSIQVHPSNKTADRTIGEQGKAEMWFIVDCESQSAIYFGFSKHISSKTLIQPFAFTTICVGMHMEISGHYI